MSRGMHSVSKVLDDEDFDLTELTVKNVNEMMGSERALNPHVMNIMVKLILDASKSAASDSSQLYLNLFNLLLSQMVLFCADIDSDIVNKLMKTCSNILQLVLKNVKQFVYEDGVVENIVNNKILQIICMGLDFDVSHLNNRKRDLLNLQVILFAIHDQVIKKKLSDFSISLDINRHIMNIFKARSIFKDGRKFNFMRHQMLMRHILSSPDKNLISKLNQEFKTDSKMFQSNINLAIESKQSMLKVHFKKFSSDDMMKVLQPDAREIELS